MRRLHLPPSVSGAGWIPRAAGGGESVAGEVCGLGTGDGVDLFGRAADGRQGAGEARAEGGGHGRAGGTVGRTDGDWPSDQPQAGQRAPEGGGGRVAIVALGEGCVSAYASGNSLERHCAAIN